MKHKFEIGDRVIMSNNPTKRGSQFLKKFTFYTISECKLGLQKNIYKVRGLDNWFVEHNFILYSRDENKWVPFEKCNNIEVGDYVKLNYDMYCSGTSEKIDEIFSIHEYRIISEIGYGYILVENDYYPIADCFLLYKKPDVSQNKSNKADIFAVDLTKNKDRTETCILSDGKIIYPSESPKIAYYPSVQDQQVFNAMQITLDAAKYSAFPFGSPDYMINVKFGGSYNNK